MTKPTPEQWGRLTRRERQVLEGLQSHKYEVVAADLGISIGMAHKHAQSARRKLGQPNMIAARYHWNTNPWRGHPHLWVLLDFLRHSLERRAR